MKKHLFTSEPLEQHRPEETSSNIKQPFSFVSHYLHLGYTRNLGRHKGAKPSSGGHIICSYKLDLLRRLHRLQTYPGQLIKTPRFGAPASWDPPLLLHASEDCILVRPFFHTLALAHSLKRKYLMAKTVKSNFGSNFFG